MIDTASSLINRPPPRRQSIFRKPTATLKPTNPVGQAGMVGMMPTNPVGMMPKAQVAGGEIGGITGNPLMPMQTTGINTAQNQTDAYKAFEDSVNQSNERDRLRIQDFYANKAAGLPGIMGARNKAKLASGDLVRL